MTNVTPVLPAAALPSLPPTENDTSLCSHLRALVSRRRTPVKTEPGEQDDSPAARAERRYVQVVRWGATMQGTKRRKVSSDHRSELTISDDTTLLRRVQDDAGAPMGMPHVRLCRLPARRKQGRVPRDALCGQHAVRVR